MLYPSGVISSMWRYVTTIIITMTTPIPLPAEVTPTSLPLPDPEAYEGEPREYARALMQRKTDIELEIVCPSARASVRDLYQV
jgi:hypothetical protein